MFALVFLPLVVLVVEKHSHPLQLEMVEFKLVESVLNWI